jgi:uncharacterized GH25 family protein
MKTIAKRLITAVAVASLMVGAAHAHRAWFVPSSTVVSGDNAWVTIDGAVSNNLFFPDHRPMQIDAISITAPDGSSVKPVNATVGQYRTTFDLKLLTRRAPTASLRPIAASTRRGRKAQRRSAGAARWPSMWRRASTRSRALQLTLSSRRVETFVTNGAPSEIKPTGKGLELVPVTHPNDLYSGEEITFKLTDNGKPAANVEVTVIAGGDRYREEAGELVVKTGADGTVKLTLENAGMYWLEAESRGTSSMEGKPVNSMSTYVAVLEVLPG